MIYVNAYTPREERRDKYAVLRIHGLSSEQAHRKRDWRWSKIRRFLGKNALFDIEAIELGWKKKRRKLKERRGQ